MDETFLININCENILFDFQETHYTMFIDSTKISIVYELVEWIRWIFSIDSCIYLAHENSVIHELEDIRVLSKLKNFEIKLCGRSHCIHKKTYRTLLNNLNLFVSWNEMKVPKYFLEKISQISQKFPQERFRIDDHLKVANTHVTQCSTINERIGNQKISSDINKSFSFDNQNLPKFNNGNFSFNNRRDLIDISEQEANAVDKSSLEFNRFDKSKISEENLLIHFEDCTDYSNSNINIVSKKTGLNTSNSVNFSPIKPTEKEESKSVTLTNKISSNSSSSKSSKKFVRPFSLGEILSNIREDFEKQNKQDAVKKNDLLQTSTEVVNFDNITTTENLDVKEGNTIGGKKRQRIRRRKKSKKQIIENKSAFSPVKILDSNSYTKDFYIFNKDNTFKPNHIRFSEDDEENSMETDFVEDKLETKQEINDSNATFLHKETPESLKNDNHQSFSNLSVVSLTRNNEDNSEINNQIGDKSKVTDFDDQASGTNFQSYSVCESFDSQDLNMLQSLKEKFKNAVVIKRFY